MFGRIRDDRSPKIENREGNWDNNFLPLYSLPSMLNTSPRNSNDKQITIDNPMTIQILTNNPKGTQLLRNSNANTNSNITLSR